LNQSSAQHGALELACLIEDIEVCRFARLDAIDSVAEAKQDGRIVRREPNRNLQGCAGEALQIGPSATCTLKVPRVYSPSGIPAAAMLSVTRIP
jgi:hypothetical protein